MRNESVRNGVSKGNHSLWSPKAKKIKDTMFNKKITSKDVAKLAGVSQPTVSRVFSSTNQSKVASEARDKVLKAAEELGYRPNFLARSMSSGKTNTVALVVGDSLGPFYFYVINKFIESIQTIGKQCLLFKLPRQNQLEGIIERVIQFQVDAVIITASAMTKGMTDVMKFNNIPVLLFNRFIQGANVNTIYVDSLEGGRMVADYLADKGHKNISYIQFTLETDEEVQKKISFLSQLRLRGITDVEIESAGYNYNEGYQAGLRLLKSKKTPTAIFCTSDLIAIGVIDAARNELNLRVPEDLAVIGYDDIDMASWASYELTTIHQPVDEMIEEAILLLQEMLQSNSNTVKIKMIHAKLIKRKSA